MPGLPIEGKQSFLGYGLVLPFARTGGADFRAAGGATLVSACVSQIVGTVQGELRWRPSFGLDAEKLRHKNMNEGLEELGRQKVADAVSTWEPRVAIIDAEVLREQTERTLRIRIVWTIEARNNPRNRVLIDPITQEVPI
jgi:phage baseplate assembly protein W